VTVLHYCLVAVFLLFFVRGPRQEGGWFMVGDRIIDGYMHGQKWPDSVDEYIDLY
jgi:hypothetical protein